MKSKIAFKCSLLLLFSLLFFTTSCDTGPTVYSSDYIRTYSFSFIIRQNDWNEAEPGHWFKRIRVPDITKSVIDYGSVLVYYRNRENNWVLLPYSTTFYDSQGYPYFTEEIWFGFALGSIDIDYIYTNPLDMTPPVELDLKIVISDYRAY